MTGRHTNLLAIGVLLAALSVFTVDIYLPLGLEDWIPYIAVVLVSLWLPSPRYVYATALLCSVLTVGGLFLSPPGAELWLAGVNRVMAIAAFWTVAVIGLKSRRIQELEKSNQALQQEIQRRRELESQLLRTQRLESIGVLTGGIAHDFNNLLTPIILAAKLLDEERSNEERQRLLETLQSSAERAAELVRKLLAFAGGMGGELTPVQVNDMVTEIVDIADRTFPKSIRIRTELSEGLPPVMGDATQLSQVLMNLCINARDAMPLGGTLLIAVNRVLLDDACVRTNPDARQGEFVRLTVEDTGCGMTPQILDQAFDPFFTTKAQGKGTGLGLSTALGIVRSHRGFLQVESEIGRGSRFAVHLPVSSPATKNPEPPLPIGALQGNGELILVVDDELPTLETVKVVLQHGGYRVHTARSGEEALDAYDRNRDAVRAVLLDMMMPGMDGLAVIARLREKNAYVHIIASSGLRVLDRTAEMFAAHRVSFLPKPYSDEQLLAALAKLLQTT